MLTSRLFGGMPTAERPPISISPSVGSSKPAIIRSVVVLPQPDGPEQREELARLHLEVDVVDRDEIPEPLGDAAQDDVRSVPRLHVARNIQNAHRGLSSRGQKV